MWLLEVDMGPRYPGGKRMEGGWTCKVVEGEGMPPFLPVHKVRRPRRPDPPTGLLPAAWWVASPCGWRGSRPASI